MKYRWRGWKVRVDGENGMSGWMDWKDSLEEEAGWKIEG